MQLTEKIYKTLFEEILEGKYSPGSRIPTEFETAARFKASRVTVRRAYAILEQAGIIIRKPRCGTVVSENFSGSTEPIRIIAAVMPLNDDFAREFLHTLCKEAAKENILIAVEPDSGSGPALTRNVIRLVSSGIRNMIFWPADSDCDSNLFSRLRVLGVNMVFFDRIRPVNKFADYVALDNRAAINTLFSEAVAAGCRNFVFGGAGNLQFDSNQDRRKVFMEECRRRGFVPETMEFPADAVLFEEEKQHLQEKLLSRNSLTALICVNDTIALQAAKLIPENYRIFSIDGTPEALRKGIISYAQPMSAMAEKCLDLLKRQQKLGKDWTAGEYYLKGELQTKC